MTAPIPHLLHCDKHRIISAGILTTCPVPTCQRPLTRTVKDKYRIKPVLVNYRAARAKQTRKTVSCP